MPTLTPVPMWQRYISGAFSLVGGLVWLVLVWDIVGEPKWPSLDVMLVLLISLPLGIVSFGWFAFKGALPKKLYKIF